MNRFLILMAFSAIAVSAYGADKVSFTRHAYDDGDYIFRTYMAPEDIPFATMIRPDDSGIPFEYKFILLSEDVKPVYSFSVKAPEDHNYCERLALANDGNDYYIQEILITQHLFNDDDLYEVVFSADHNGYVIYNEKGEFLGSCPSNKLYRTANETYIYMEYDSQDDGRMISSLYSVNKGDSSVLTMAEERGELTASPNPVKENENITLTLPVEMEAGATIKVFNTNGSLLIQKKLEKGEKEVLIPSYRLTDGVNPVIAIDEEGEIIATGKIMKN